MNLERSENLIDHELFWRCRRLQSERVFSQGRYLWKLQRQLRDRGGQEGNIGLLTPDSEGAFVAALLHLYKDPLHQSKKKRSRTMQSEMREAAIATYGSTPRKDENLPRDSLRCALTHQYYDQKLVKAVRIVPASVRSRAAL